MSFQPDDVVWLLTLDQIESHTGAILEKSHRAAGSIGNSTFAFDTGHVLYSKLRPYLNKVVCPDEMGIATTELIPLRPRSAILDRRYLAHYLRSPGFLAYASQYVTGAKMPRVISDRFWEHEIPLPPLSEQRRIVEILDQADRVRRLRAEADAKADRILPALFIKMFGDLATNPRGLPKERLGDLIGVKSGAFLPAKAMDPAGTCPVYGGNGVAGHHSEFMFEHAVVILGRVGAYCGVVHYTRPCSWVTDNALYVGEKREDLEDRYLEWALRTANLNQYAGRAGQPLISAGRIYPVEILVPIRADQVRFAATVNRLEAARGMSVSAARRVQDFWGVVLHLAFKGDLTASWREAHMNELLQEIEHQAKALAEIP